MPRKPPSHVPHPPLPIEQRRARERQRWHRRQAEGDQSFYGRTAWRRLRVAFLMVNPLCAECRRQGRDEPALHVHHVLSRAERPDLELDEANLEGLCHSCHSRLTCLQDGGFGHAKKPRAEGEGGAPG